MFFFSSRRRHTRLTCDWSSDVCSSDLVEVGTSVCSNIKDAKAEVKKLRSNMVRLAKENGLRLASAATHPFSDWRTQEIHRSEERRVGKECRCRWSPEP